MSSSEEDYSDSGDDIEEEDVFSDEEEDEDDYDESDESDEDTDDGEETDDDEFLEAARARGRLPDSDTDEEESEGEEEEESEEEEEKPRNVSKEYAQALVELGFSDKPVRRGKGSFQIDDFLRVEPGEHNFEARRDATIALIELGINPMVAVNLAKMASYKEMYGIQYDSVIEKMLLKLSEQES